ncbi:MAG: putative baseplate assembly protein [Egibacteraceae bacterium]
MRPPRRLQVSLIGQQRAGWIRCRVLPHEDGRPDYSDSPKIISLSARTIGGTAACVHTEIVSDEILGLPEGVPGQRFAISRRPVVSGREPTTLEVAAGQGWDAWTEVADFADSGPDSRHFVLDTVAGEVQLGPAVREPDGTLRQFGAVPPTGAPRRLCNYCTGGGRRGNAAAGAVNVLKSSTPYVDRVANRLRAAGGVEGDDIVNAKLRGPILMRTRNRAVTLEDYAQLAREAAPEAARVRCVPAGEAGTEAGAVRVLVVPAVDGEQGRLRFEQFIPDAETLARIAQHLDERRDRRQGHHRASHLPWRHGRRPPPRPPARAEEPAASGGARGALLLLPPAARRPRPGRLAVRAPGPRRRGLRGPATAAGHGVRRRGAAVRRRRRHRQPGLGCATHRPGPARAGVLFAHQVRIE